MRSRRKSMWCFLPCLALAWMWVFSAAVPTRGQGVGAEISGAVTDATGAALAGAKITLTDQATGVTRVITTSSDGHYAFPDLPNGTYSLRVDQAGFAPAEARDIVLNIGASVERNVQMKVGAVQQQVTVEAQGPPIDVTKSQVAGVVTQDQISSLPVNSRQYLNLALLMPGTSQDAARPFYNNVSIGAGGTFYGNGFFADGVRNTWAEQGEPRQDFPEGGVSEFKVYTTQYPATLGLATGGFITVASKSGTNQFHGDVFEYWRNEALNALNKFQAQQQEMLRLEGFPFNRNQYGADLGGPIVRNKAHFFTSFERTQTKDSFTVFTGLPQFYSSVEGTFNKPSWRDLWLARYDQKLTDKQTMFVRYAGEREFQGCFDCGGTSAANSGFDQKIPRESVVLGHTWMESSTLLNDFRFQYAFSEYEIGVPGFPIWTQFGQYPPQRIAQLDLVLSFPSLTYGGNFQELGPEKRAEWNDDLTVIHGTHELHFGVEYDYIPFKDDSPNSPKGQYFFGIDQPFNPNDPSLTCCLKDATLFLETQPSISTVLNTSYWGGYMMDNWRATPRLNATLGLRYDRQIGSFDENVNLSSLPRVLPYVDLGKRGDRHNVGPRVGVSWDLTGSGKSIVRAGFGIYYNNIRTLVNFSEPRNLLTNSIFIVNPPYPNPFGPGQDFNSFITNTPPNIYILANDFVNPYSEQFNLGFTRQLTDTLSLNVDGAYVHSLRDYKVIDINPVNAAGVRPLADWGEIQQAQSTIKGKYGAMYLRLQKRYSHHYQYLISYTLADCKDNDPGEYSVAPEPSWGYCNIDRRHTLVASGSFQLPWQLVVGAIWTVRSTLPFNNLSENFDFDGVQQFVPGTSRNQGNRNLNIGLVNAYRATLNLPPISSSQFNSSRYNGVDIRVAKRIFVKNERQLELGVQVFNLFGTDNLLAPFTSAQVTDATSPLFGEITTAFPRQQAELSAKFAW